ncbi:MAG TPA: hypothetical protein VFB13_17795 [Reyranella sp.]|nr:hypothetical protein [Reyranella sp.]
MAKVAVVETNLDEPVEVIGGRLAGSYVRRARTRFVEEKPAVLPMPPRLGDRWEPLTVRARLQRMAEVFRRVPHDPDTRPGQYRSCMPTPVREIFKDQPAEPMRVPVSRAELAAAKQVLDSLITLTWEQRVTAWAIANKLSDRRLAKEIHCSHPTASDRKNALLRQLAADWNARGWTPDDFDLEHARSLIRRIID